MERHRSRRANRAPGRCRAGGGLATAGCRHGGKDPTGRFSWLALALVQNSKHVVVAGGGVVAEDGRQRIGVGDAARRDVEAAAHTLAVAAPETCLPTDGVVVIDRGAQEGEGRECVLEDPAAQAVAAEPAGTADGEVVGERAAAYGERRAEQIGEAGAPAVA